MTPLRKANHNSHVVLAPALRVVPEVETNCEGCKWEPSLFAHTRAEIVSGTSGNVGYPTLNCSILKQRSVSRHAGGKRCVA